MQANGADQGQDPGLSCQNNSAQNRENGENGEGSSGRRETAHSNGLLSGSGTGNNVAHTGTSALLSSGTGNVKKQKRLSQSEEDVIRLIGQHLHGLGLK